MAACACAFAAIVPCAKGEARLFNISPSHTTVKFTLRHFFSSVTGQFRDVHGTLRIDPDHPENAVVSAACPSHTVDTANSTRDGHLRTELFEVEKFPEITFRSRKVVRTASNQADVTGDLTLHGVTRPLLLHVTLLARTKNADGHEMSRWRASGGKFSRRAFGLLWPSAVEAVSMIGDEISLEIESETIATD